MSTSEYMNEFKCSFSVVACIFLTFSYVSSLYVWRSKLSRDHPSTIKRRFFSVSVMMLLAPFFVQIFFTKETLNKGDLFTQMGLQPVYWFASWQDLVWVRNHVMAPLSEEWVFRACMTPLLLQCLEPMTAVFVGPVLFGIAHFHHMLEQIKAGFAFKTALLVSTFQFTYTSMFGAYSAYLFLRTGHFVAPLVVHMFCNHMGFPNFGEIREFPPLQRLVIAMSFLLGLGLWCLLLVPLTNPELYNNRLHWET
ncbi:unnamed protein product [Arctia plantaginis]|uniref:CAAX prenyl protease 2 n=1 Tax=Arctia plantaginis TaxID=874455 RepID=A0A8S1AJJ6_ARCPL|nr:unnamed protein product [Arctia plantaginis]